jgi:ribonuclease-3
VKDSKKEAKIAGLEAKIGVEFENGELLLRAVTHGSYANERVGADVADNQRLEFLGDAILDFVVGEWLYARYPDAPEGELTSLRAHVVSTRGLAAFAREIDLGSELRLGRGESASGGHNREANLCAAFEALVGAIYLDRGMDAARQWVGRFLREHAGAIDARRRTKDAKSLLQEHTQAELHVTPKYTIVEETGLDHAKTFVAQVVVGSEVWGEGTGPNKQAAEQAAAATALRVYCPPNQAERI